MRHDVDVDLILQTLRDRGHSLGNVIPVPDNAGDYEFVVDGRLLSLSEVRLLMQEDAEEETHRGGPGPHLVDPQTSNPLKS
jgi:hypothetical protein